MKTRERLLLALLPLAAAACSEVAIDAVLQCAPADERPECPRPEPTASASEPAPEPTPTMTVAPEPPPRVWPNELSGANSDPWLVEHHDDLLEMRPKLVVLNFYNALPGDAILPSLEREIEAIAQGSRYHGYLDDTAPAFLHYEIASVVDLTDGVIPPDQPNAASALVPVDSEGAFDPQALFSDAFTNVMQIPDPRMPGRFLSMCELFEQGVANEVWLAVADSTRQPPLMMERKQVYDRDLVAVPGEFQPCVVSAGYCLQASCGVTVRLAHFNPRRGPGCDLQVRGWSIVETGFAVPYFAENANPFFNADFRRRFGTSFESLHELCVDGGDCVSYPSESAIESVETGNGAWRIDPYWQGCGTPDFPPNATGRWVWDSTQPVQSRCDHYRLLDGEAGSDRYEAYSAERLRLYESWFASEDEFLDCGGGWQLYWRQNLPGLHNRAVGMDGKAMKNWWPFMFY